MLLWIYRRTSCKGVRSTPEASRPPAQNGEDLRRGHYRVGSAITFGTESFFHGAAEGIRLAEERTLRLGFDYQKGSCDKVKENYLF